MPRPTKTRARERLQRVLDAIADLKQLQRGSPEFDKWHRDTKVAIANTFARINWMGPLSNDCARINLGERLG